MRSSDFRRELLEGYRAVQKPAAERGPINRACLLMLAIPDNLSGGRGSNSSDGAIETTATDCMRARNVSHRDRAQQRVHQVLR